MKKRKLKKFCLGLCIIMFIQLTPTYASDLSMTDYQIRQMMAEQERAVAANDCIVNGMGLNTDGTLDYEDDFAGARIENNKLILSLTDCSDSTKEKYLKWASDYVDVVEFEKVEFSYNYLKETANEVLEVLYEQTGKYAVGYYVSEVENNIVVKIDQETKELLDRRRSNINYGVPVEYEVSDVPETVSTEEVVGGAHLQNFQNGENISVGCCGYFRGVPSIATCGHGITGVGDQFWVNDGAGGYVGSVAHHNFESGRAGDYAIISGRNSYYEFTNKIGSTYRINGTISSPAVGTYVYFYGNTTQRYCFGIVAERWMTAYVGDDVLVRELTCVTVLDGTVAEGDSGGPVFTVETGTTNAKFGGVINAYTTATGSMEMYFTPAALFTSLGFSVLTS